MPLFLVLLGACDLVPDLYVADGARECDPRTAFYADSDGDGLGNALSMYVGCEAPEGYVANADDCDDADAGVGTPCPDTGDTGESAE